MITTDFQQYNASITIVYNAFNIESNKLLLISKLLILPLIYYLFKVFFLMAWQGPQWHSDLSEGYWYALRRQDRTHGTNLMQVSHWFNELYKASF